MTRVLRSDAANDASATMPDDPRDELAEAVQYGRMTPNDAEAKLKELGLRPLAPQPNPADYNAMNEVWWSLPMTVAWIAWRTSADVREAWDRYRKELTYWKHEHWQVGFDGPVYEGFFLKPAAPASLSTLALTEIYRRAEGTQPKEALSIKDAKAALWTALSLGALEATGKLNDLAARVVIPEHEWRDLVDVERSGRDEVRSEKIGLAALHGYVDLAFKSKAVTAIWSPSRREDRGLVLSETIAPVGPGYFALFCAVQWIATRGGTRNLEQSYVPIWEQAYSELLARVSSNHVTVTGMRGGTREKIEGHLFASIVVDHPFKDISLDSILNDDLHLQSYGYTDEESWRRGFDDSLRNRRGIQWSQLMVLKSQIAEWWPFDAELLVPETHSGGAGRPSMMHLVEEEYDARHERGQSKGTLVAIARELAAWAKATHPTLRHPTSRTIENALREKHRQRTK